jgi:two-component system sensor histidine kinase KdpD
MERQLRGLRVTTAIDDDLPPVPIDAILIQQVLTNLLDNAQKFTPPGGRIELGAKRSGNALAVEVADSGPGIPTGELDRIFEKFYRATRSQGGDAHGGSGSGIGLAIARGIVVLHGGQIVAENRPGGGAVFRFTLPLGDVASSAPADDAERLAPEPAATAEGRARR